MADTMDKTSKHGRFYNRALFENMSSFSDVVWEICVADRTVYVLKDNFTPSLSDRVLTLDEIAGYVVDSCATKDKALVSQILTVDYIRSLKGTFRYECMCLVGGKYDTLTSVLTPDFEEDESIEYAYLSIVDIQQSLDQRKETEKSRQELDRFLSAVSCGIIQYTRDSKKLVYANDTALKILGYSSLEEMQDDSFDGVVNTVNQDDSERIKELINSLKVESDVVECEYHVRHKDGVELVCFGTIRIIYRGFDEPLIQRSMVDITDTRKAGMLYQEMTDTLSVAKLGLWSFILGDDEPKFFMDKTTSMLVGASETIPPEEAYNFWFDRIDPDYLDKVLGCVALMRTGTPAEVIYPYHHPTRGTVTIRCGGILDGDYMGDGVMLRGYHQDITESNEKLLEQLEIGSAVNSHFYSVLELNFNKMTSKVLSGSRSLEAVEGQPIFSEERPLQQELMSHTANITLETLQIYNSICDIDKLRETLTVKKGVEVEVDTYSIGWVRITVIPSNVSSTGDVDKAIALVENIEKEKAKVEELEIISNTDALTELNNRHAYEEKISTLEKGAVPSDLWIISMDLNGLKESNDTIGHHAGDELLKGMASCLSKTFSDKGEVYRVGGDEFSVIAQCSKAEMDAMLLKLEEYRAGWHGNLNHELNFSKGVVCADEITGCSISMLEKEADKRMYDEKRRYYSTKGDRRRRE